MSLRVVLVDDDEHFRAAARRALGADGIEVVAEAKDGMTALDVVARWNPDVVLLDIGLPGIDGLEVARRLAAEAGPVVILISTREEAHGRRLAAGLAAGYLPKNELSQPAILELADLAP